MGIEPTPEAWEASVLPLNYARAHSKFSARSRRPLSISFSPMQLIVNGIARELPERLAVSGLIDTLRLAGKRCAVEVNGDIVPRSAHGETLLKPGDRVEVVLAVGGG